MADSTSRMRQRSRTISRLSCVLRFGIAHTRLQHHVAFASNRSMAFEPWVREETSLPFLVDRWPWRVARVPLSALVNVGGGSEILYERPRAVS